MTRALDMDVGVIGAGNMGEALIRGVLKAGLVTPERVHAWDTSPQRLARASETLGVQPAQDNRDVVSRSVVVILAVKPQSMADVLEGIASVSSPEHLFISIAAGIAAQFVEGRLCEEARVVRVMPNTPALVGEGMAAVAGGRHASEADVALAQTILGAVGRCVRVDEALMDAVTALSGSGPAYVFYLVEAMVEAGVAEGLSESQALELARQTVLGAGRLLVESGEEPAELRRKVTSPGGTTEAAIASMESDNVRAALVRAIRGAAGRSRELGR